MNAPLLANDRFVSLSPTAGTTVLNYDFELLAPGDLTVVRRRGTTRANLQLGVDFVFPLGTGGANGGSLHLVSPAQDGDVYQLISYETINRVSDFLQQQRFAAEKFNADLDKLTRVGQEARRDIERALKVDFGQPGGRVEIPAPGHFLKADDEGNLVDGGSADDIAAAQANAAQVAADRVIVETARDQILAVATTVTAPKATLQELKDNAPAINPGFYEVAYFDEARQRRSRSRWRFVGANPGLAPGAAVQNANGAWYVNDDEWLEPEKFGRIGVDVAGDTAAWRAVVSVANWRVEQAKVRLEGDQYLIAGTGAEDDHFTFRDLPSVWIRLGPDSEPRQRAALAKMFKFLRVKEVKVTGGKTHGFAQTQIDAGVPLTELDLEQSSGNAVAAIFARDCGVVRTQRFGTRNHFGRDILTLNCDETRVIEPDLSGVGPKYNDPSGGAYPLRYPIAGTHQGNGEDAAIYAIPTDLTSGGSTGTRGTGKAWKQKLVIQGGSITGHSFGVRTILNGLLQIHGVDFGEQPGQHHIYDTDSDGISVQGNMMGPCRQWGFKTQLENLAGFNVGPLWQNGTTYAVGDVVRAFSVLWICNTAHTSIASGSFTSTNWTSHPRNLRRGGIITGNTLTKCGYGISQIAATPVNARNIWSEGLVVRANTLIDTVTTQMQLDRCTNATVEDNTAIGGCANYGIFGRYFSGSMKNNDMRSCGFSAILISLAGETIFEDNKTWNAGQAASDAQNRTPIVIYALTANDPPSFVASPRAFFKRNGFFYPTGDAPGDWLLFCSDTRISWEITDTYGTTTTKKFRIDGSVAYQTSNHFDGFVNTAQNLPAFTAEYSNDFNLEAASTLSGVRDVLGTFLAQMRTRRLIR